MADNTFPYPAGTSNEDADILNEAREWLQMVTLAEKEIREEGAKCLRFRAGEQWEQTILASRGAARPSLVMDHTGQFIDQVVNDWRRNRMGIQVSPGDDISDDETARVIEGKVREIEYRSKAYVAYDKMCDQMVGQNRSYVRICLDRRPGTFQKDIRVKHIPNPDCVYFDPFAVEADYSDAMRCLVVDRLGIKQYKADWGNKAKEVDFSPYAHSGDYSAWITDDSIMVGEWWCVKLTPRKIQKLTKKINVIRNNRALTTDTVYDDEWNPEDPQHKGVTVALDANNEPMEDDEPKREVWQYIVNGVQVLDKVQWPGTRIPIKPCYGRELLINGKKRLYSLISRQLDAQQALNYSVSSGIQAIALAPIAPWVGLVGQFKTFEKQWAESNRVPYGILQHDPVELPGGGVYTEPPQRQVQEPPIQQTSYMTQQLVQFMKAEVGMYGANLGDREGKVRSGAAEKALQNEGDNASFDFLDNASRTVEMVGCDIVELIPVIYSGPQLTQIRDAQNRVITVAVNMDPQGIKASGLDQERPFMINQGTYSVTVSAAPSHDTMRKESQEMTTEMLQYMNPQQQSVAVPEILRLAGFFGAKELADRLDPPQEGQQIPPEVVQQIQVRDQTIEALTEHVNKLKDIMDAKQQDLDLRWKESCLEAAVKLRVAEVTASKDADSQNANTLADLVTQAIANAHEVGMSAMEHQQNKELTGMQANAAMQQDAQAQQASMAQQQQAQEAQPAQATQ